MPTPRWIAPLAAAGLVAGVSFAELSFWALRGVRSDALPVVAATLALAALAAGLAYALAFALRPAWAAALAAAAGVWAFAVHAVGALGLGAGGSALATALAFAGAGAALAGIAASRRRVAFGLALAAGLALAPAALVVGGAPDAPRAQPRADAPDVVLLVLDTTRRDRLSLYGHPQRTTPELDALARDARVYDDAWSAAPWTSPSHASLFTGLLPAEHDVDGEDAPPLPPDAVTLAGVLRRAGWRTAGFAANPNLHAPGWARDFDVYQPPWWRGAHTLVEPLNGWWHGGVDGWSVDRSTSTTARVFADARRWWAANDDAPRFLFLNVLDPHAPYAAPPADRERFVRGRDCARAAAIAQGGRYEYADTRVTRAERACIGALYDAELFAMDREVGAFFRWMAGRGELDATLVAITSDHGERLGEGGHVGHLLEMDQHLLRVPLVVRYPAVLAPERIEERVMLTGLPGFLLGLVGVAAPEPMAQRGFHAQRGGPALAQHRNFGWYTRRIQKDDPDFDFSRFRGDWHAVADERFLLRWSPEQGPDAAQLFDYRADADLRHDLAAERPEAVASLRAIASGLPAFPDGEGGSGRAPLDPQTRQRLRDLGYVD